MYVNLLYTLKTTYMFRPLFGHFREVLYVGYVTKNHNQCINIKYLINLRILYAPLGFILTLKYQWMVLKYLKFTHSLFFLPTTKLVTSLM